MVKVIVGLKGSGKTKRLVDLVRRAVEEEHGDVICIEKDKNSPRHSVPGPPHPRQRLPDRHLRIREGLHKRPARRKLRHFPHLHRQLP